jgi:hypothetical protein
MSSRREHNIIIMMKECATAEICLSADLVGNDIIVKKWIEECYDGLGQYYGSVPLNYVLGLEEIIQQLIVTTQWLWIDGKAVEAAVKACSVLRSGPVWLWTHFSHNHDCNQSQTSHIAP